MKADISRGSMKAKKSVQWEESAPWITPALVRGARGLLGWSQQELAKKAGVGVSIVIHFERGTRDPDPASRLQIVFAFSRARIRFCRSNNHDSAVKQMVGVQLLGTTRSFHP